LLNTGIYIGQTITKFSQRFNGHRQNWSIQIKNKNFENDDKYALYKHYRSRHQQYNLPATIEEAYTIFFLEQPKPENLNNREDFWKHHTQANINITKMTTSNIH